MSLLLKPPRELLYTEPIQVVCTTPEEREREVRCFVRKIVKFGGFLKILPFQWEEESGLISVVSKRDRVLVNLNLLCIFLYAGVKLHFLLHRQFLPNESSERISYSITGSLFFVMFSLALLLHLNNVCNLDEIVSTVNTYCHRIRAELGEIFHIKRSIHLLDVLWSAYIVMLHLLGILGVPLFMRSNTNFGTVVDWKLSVILLLLDLYCLYVFAIVVAFYVFLIVDCAAVVEKLSKGMTSRIHGITHICLSAQRIDELRRLSQYCNEIQIAFVSYKSIMEPLILPLFLAVATVLSSLGLFTVVKFFGELGIFFSMILSLGESVCVSITSLGLCQVSNICNNNELLQKELCHLQLVPKRNKKELKVMMRCIRPIRFRIGIFFPVSKQTAVDFLETLCSWLTTLLLTCS